MHSYRFRLFPLGFITGLFDPHKLVEAIRESCQDGYRLLRREFSIERRRVLFFFSALSFGIVSRRKEQAPDTEYDYRVAVYRTRFFTRTVNIKDMTNVLNHAANGGYEFFFGIKYPTRLLLLFPRESYIFFFRKPYSGTVKNYSYRILQTPYRFFSRTIDPTKYEAELSSASKNGQLKISFRDERRVFGLFTQPTVIGIFESENG